MLLKADQQANYSQQDVTVIHFKHLSLTLLIIRLKGVHTTTNIVESFQISKKESRREEEKVRCTHHGEQKREKRVERRSRRREAEGREKKRKQQKEAANHILRCPSLPDQSYATNVASTMSRGGVHGQPRWPAHLHATPVENESALFKPFDLAGCLHRSGPLLHRLSHLLFTNVIGSSHHSDSLSFVPNLHVFFDVVLSYSSCIYPFKVNIWFDRVRSSCYLSIQGGWWGGIVLGGNQESTIIYFAYQQLADQHKIIQEEHIRIHQKWTRTTRNSLWMYRKRLM
ncbi:hypothetical protein LXL04_035104 [Taraxacum kok-saghyz]